MQKGRPARSRATKKPPPTAAPAARSRAAANAPDARRDELAIAAYHLIAEKGFEGLRTRDVAANVGINISTLHYHFETKEELIAGVIGYVATLFATLHPPLPPGATPFDEFLQVCQLAAYRRRHAPELEVVLEELMLRARRDERVRAAFDSLQSRWHAIVCEIVTRCVREKYLRPDLDAKAVAAIVTSYQIGASMQLGVSPARFSFEQVAASFASWLAAPDASPAKRRR